MVLGKNLLIVLYIYKTILVTIVNFNWYINGHFKGFGIKCVLGIFD